MNFGVCYFFSDNTIQNMKTEQIEINGFQQGLLVNFEFTQTFIHNENEEKEVYFAFHNNFRICIYDITFVIGGKITKQKLQSKEKMDTTNNDSANSTPYSFNTNQNMIQMKVGNIQPKIECKIILKLAFIGQQIERKSFFIRIPFDVSTSNFFLKLQCDKDSIEKVKSNVKTAIFDEKTNIFSIENKIEKSDNENTIIITFEAKDLITSLLTIAPTDQIDYNYCALTISPNLPSFVNATNLEFIFIIDCSGSMIYDSIEKASECLQLFIKSLPKNSFFNVVRFGSNYEKLFEKSAPYNDRNAQKAIGLAKSLRADACGSDIYSVLESIYEEENQYGQRQIFILTDGIFQDIDRVLGLISSHSDKNRCFTVGIGLGCKNDFIEKIAQITGGKSDFVLDGDSISDIVIPLLHSSLHPLLSIKVNDKNGDDLFDISPTPLPLIDPNQSTVIFLHNKTRGDEKCLLNEIYISGSCDKRQFEFPIEKVKRLVNVEEDSFGCSKGQNICKCIFPLFSFHYLQEIERKNKISDEEKLKAVEMSISSGVLCRYTEFVGMIENSNQQVDFEVFRILHEDRQMINHVNENLDNLITEVRRMPLANERTSKRSWFGRFFGRFFGRKDD